MIPLHTDRHNRWRCKTISFRASPEENEAINRHAALAGLTKQEYISRRCQHLDVVVQGANPRIYKALKKQLEVLISSIKELEDDKKPLDPEFWDTVEMTISILNKMSTKT